MFISESRVFLPDGTEHRASQSSLSECISLKIPNSSLSVAIADTKSKKPPSQVDIARSPQWMVESRGQRGLLSRQNAVSQSSTPDSTPRLMSPVDGLAFTPSTPIGLMPCFSRAFSPRSSISWTQGSQDESSVSRSELLKPFNASTFQSHSPCSDKPICQLQRSSSSVTARPDPNSLWKDSALQFHSVQTDASSSNSTPFLLMGSHLSRSKSHPRPRSHHDLEDINMFDPYPRQTSNDSSSLNDYKQISCTRLHQSQEKSDSLATDSVTDEKIGLDKTYTVESSMSQGEESSNSSNKMHNLSIKKNSTQFNQDLLLTYSDCSSSEIKLEAEHNNKVDPPILAEPKMSDEASGSVTLGSDGHLKLTGIQSSSPALYESLLDSQLPVESDKCLLLAMYTENQKKRLDETRSQSSTEAQTNDSRYLCKPMSPLASPARPNFLSLTTKQTTSSSTSSPPLASVTDSISVSLNAEALAVAPPSERQEKILSSMKLTPLSLTVALSTPHVQKSPTSHSISSRPVSVDGLDVLPGGGRQRRCAQIGRMQAISDSDEFLSSDKH